MWRKIINGRVTSITGAAIVIGGASVISRILGVVRDRVLAGQFGAGDYLDIYYAAFRLPDFVFNIIVLGGLSAGFIPLFTQQPQKSKPDAWRLANNTAHLMLSGLIIICGLLVILTPWILPLIAPGFEDEKKALTITLSRVMFLSPILLGISGIIGGVLQSFKKFIAYALAPVWYNIGIIIGVLIIAPKIGIVGLAWGVVLGAALHLLTQLPSLFFTGWRWQFIFNPFDLVTRELWRLMVPRTLSLIILQINLVVITILASTLPTGSLAVFNLANNLQSFPLSIFGISFAVAAFPTIAAFAQSKNFDEFSRVVTKTLRQIIFLVIPISALFILLRAQIVRVILGTGAFDWQATILTANALGLFSLSLFAQATTPMLARAFYSLHNTLTPFAIGLVSAIINLFASLIFMKFFGVIGLALAFSLASVAQMILMWSALRPKLKITEERQILMTLWQICLATLGMGLVVQVLKYLLAMAVNMQTFIGIFSQALIAGIFGVIVYYLLMLLQ